MFQRVNHRHHFERRHIEVRGLVQGVGFRPFVYRLAEQLQLTGFVRNDSTGVVIEVEGVGTELFANQLLQDLPPLARIDKISNSLIATRGDTDFTIAESESGDVLSCAIPTDAGICEQCLEELFDSSNRRYLHPFIACCNCGPRYAMTRHLPYDRDSTTMAAFKLCPQCDVEYRNTRDRRFHAEPIACHDCGPVISHPMTEAARLIKNGGIVALKGIGGFHLICDASNDSAVLRLRGKKQRDGKPFAVMVLNVASARHHVEVPDEHAAILTSDSRPVVVLPSRREPQLSSNVAPATGSLGVMLPYTPLHYLLFHALLGQPDGHDWLKKSALPALVMTSANLGGDPLIADNEQAREKLRDIADLIIDHNRDISACIDDSVISGLSKTPIMIRRARGYAPDGIRLNTGGPVALGVGAYLKNTVAMINSDVGYLSPHIGDLQSPATIHHYHQSVDFLLDMLQTTPEVVACDLHPDYASSQLAEKLSDQLQIPLIKVQHHHAHAAAVIAESYIESPVLALALDGHGAGPNGEAWGGELLRVDATGFERLGHLTPLPLVGGDRAARQPWRLAAGALHLMGRNEEITQRFPLEAMAGGVAQLLASQTVPNTTAAGRLFDAAAGLLNVCHNAAFEADAPIRLQALVSKLRVMNDGFSIEAGELNIQPLLIALADMECPRTGAELFHGTLIVALTDWVASAAEAQGLETVVLTGGCLLNPWLAEHLPLQLSKRGLKAILPRQLSPDDSGLSLGQAWVARQQLLNTANNNKGEGQCA